MFALVESGVDAAVEELAQVHCQVQWNVRETLLPGFANAIALRASITTPGDLKGLRVAARFFLCCIVDLIQRPAFQWDLGLPLGYNAV
jgi:hypothetical protein